MDLPDRANDKGELVATLASMAGNGTIVVALAGPPGVGKSTLAQELCDALNVQGHASKVLPMDGFHLDDHLLEKRGWREQKGAAHTFDVLGLKHLLERIRSNTEAEIYYPVFDRKSEISRAAAGVISADDKVILVEGNYLLLDRPHWREMKSLFDLSVMVSAPLDVLRARLTRRWQGLGLSGEPMRHKIEDNDLANARLIIEQSLPADVAIEN
ncbi:nucleoside/nucleotide kinase family protein [Pelagibacterium lentulum]|uniref:Nucleoside triphosphate hydrolase n=1 Tax=Pelagibacterium lentulum TaxID=2029865 RepID=A0A916R6T7_9HYPH|nr:nucleoside/nucleotide kinase family protein [Pelagibacterium lentulum]GGA38637.1 nucleoside triphosphate hydrolase [Pelagibacterium lentulum]